MGDGVTLIQAALDALQVSRQVLSQCLRDSLQIIPGLISVPARPDLLTSVQVDRSELIEECSWDTMAAAEAPTSPSLQELIGNASSIPAWLDPERFLRPDFDPELAVLDLRRFVSSIRPWSTQMHALDFRLCPACRFL